MTIVERPRIYEGTRIPSTIPTVLQVPEELDGSDDLLQVNFGPNHPSTHGVLRLIVDLNGEEVVGLKAVIGYLHTGFEKNMEAKSWWKAITYAPRIDYLAFQAEPAARPARRALRASRGRSRSASPSTTTCSRCATAPRGSASRSGSTTARRSRA